MGKKVKKHSAGYKFKVVLESFIKDNVSEVARQYNINTAQLSQWRKQCIEQGHRAFEKDNSGEEKKIKKKIEQLENFIGKKEVEINLLNNYLDFHIPLNGF